MTAIRVLDDWPRDMDRDLALLGSTVSDLEQRIGVSFRRECDELDAFSFLPIRIGKTDFVLQAYDNSPAQGVVVLSRDDTPQALTAYFYGVIAALGLTTRDVTWRSAAIDDVNHSQDRPWQAIAIPATDVNKPSDADEPAPQYVYGGVTRTA